MTGKDNRAAVRDFLASRRGRISPAQAGLPHGLRRRVPGLRREEVAMLAGVSSEWYRRLEKGHIAGVSEEVLDAVARALQLDDEERTYLFELSRAARQVTRSRRCRAAEPLPPQVRWMLDAMTMSAAFVTNGRWDVLAGNALGRALFAPMLAGDVARDNLARYHFLDPGAGHFYDDWAGAADTVVALLRAEAGRFPCDAGLRGLIDELSAASTEFGRRWAAHDILLRNHGVKRFRHPVVGTIELAYHSMELPTAADASHRLTSYAAEPGSAAEEQLRLIASWSMIDTGPGR
ncbi:transcriptional regulator [Virgisporangium aliadipatigenens]|uniref:Transcriptional regulator n=1 Tax=Virgisporangium aliadipatigenens TaxID=741659 RepID=A0A8J3YKV8_9ACTN|nr:helix-turn-helix transcriptional regulator [Virgisporangium aliadipatigenens]GIJ46177.1 transcriptional regulator [Virgisporangium aliadipatigenens]